MAYSTKAPCFSWEYPIDFTYHYNLGDTQGHHELMPCILSMYVKRIQKMHGKQRHAVDCFQAHLVVMVWLYINTSVTRILM